MGDLEFAREFAVRVHKGQVDKAGKPYYLHPFAVADGVQDETAKIAAYLHDTAEDTEVTINEIRILFGDRMAEVVDFLTRRDGEDYQSYIRRLSRDPVARKVKLSDLRHNMDMSRLPKIDSKAIQRRKKYEDAMNYIQAVEEGRETVLF